MDTSNPTINPNAMLERAVEGAQQLDVGRVDFVAVHARKLRAID